MIGLKDTKQHISLVEQQKVAAEEVADIHMASEAVACNRSYPSPKIQVQNASISAPWYANHTNWQNDKLEKLCSFNAFYQVSFTFNKIVCRVLINDNFCSISSSAHSRTVWWNNRSKKYCNHIWKITADDDARTIQNQKMYYTYVFCRRWHCWIAVELTHVITVRLHAQSSKQTSISSPSTTATAICHDREMAHRLDSRAISYELHFRQAVRAISISENSHLPHSTRTNMLPLNYLSTRN